MVKEDFHPAEMTFVVLGDFETDVFRFVFREIVFVTVSKFDIGAHESVVIAETVVGVIGKKRELLINNVAQ